MADHPAQARGVSRGVRRIRPAARGGVRRRRRRAAARRGIVRNRAKIEATIANARATIELAAGGGSLAGLVWSFAPRGRRRAPRALADVPAATPESRALSKELKRRGFRFVGPTTAYALMQACGLVNDHVAGCCVRAEVETERGEKSAK